MGSVNEIKITATRRTEKMDAWEPRMATFPLNPTQTPTTLFLCPPLPLIWPPRHSCLCRRLLQLCLTCLVYWVRSIAWNSVKLVELEASSCMAIMLFMFTFQKPLTSQLPSTGAPEGDDDDDESHDKL
ncbi:unnamed protein product [Cuscuta europaea]|uniref:Uncharacterized protein n=1 Tax=Cuscuta europaea TaxID=41803 RepID=A0A9P1ECF7_CUSEU|nr:unnamed protein product [Cuscuta europaea]